MKFAVSVIGPFIVTLAGLLAPVNDPEPLPVHPLKLKPLAGVAEIDTTCPLLNQALDGLTVPPVPAFIVRKCCVVKLAVNVVLLVGDTECEIAPPSLQLAKEKRVPADPFCGDVVLIVWLEPGVQLNV